MQHTHLAPFWRSSRPAGNALSFWTKSAPQSSFRPPPSRPVLRSCTSSFPPRRSARAFSFPAPTPFAQSTVSTCRVKTGECLALATLVVAPHQDDRSETCTLCTAGACLAPSAGSVLAFLSPRHYRSAMSVPALQLQDLPLCQTPVQRRAMSCRSGCWEAHAVKP